MLPVPRLRTWPLALLCAGSCLAYQYDLRATVMVDGETVELPRPLYFTDVYMGVWDEYDLTQHPDLDLGDKVYYVPNKEPGPFYIGPMSSANFGDPDTVRRKLTIIKNAGLYPMPHIMSRRLIRKEGSAHTLCEWNDYGALVDGEMLYSYDLFNALYRPILEELRLPYILIYDLWGFDYWAPPGIPNDVFNRLYWEELENVHTHLSFSEDSRTDMHIRMREYSPRPDAVAYKRTVYLMGSGNLREPREACAQDLRISLILSLGEPGGSGCNPHNGRQLGLNRFFWITWYAFTPDVRLCPRVESRGMWNIVNTHQMTDFSTAWRQNEWAESVDDLGPRYFYGYIHHIHDKRRNPKPRHDCVSGTQAETLFLTHRAVEKGMVFTGVWNEYSESIVMEPAGAVGEPADCHEPWADGRPVFLDSFTARRIPVELPPALGTPQPPSGGGAAQ